MITPPPRPDQQPQEEFELGEEGPAPERHSAMSGVTVSTFKTQCKNLTSIAELDRQKLDLIIVLRSKGTIANEVFILRYALLETYRSHCSSRRILAG